MVTRADIIAAARSMKDTPFRHQGRKPGVALDCWGLIICTAWECGLPFEDFTEYDEQPDAETVLRVLDERMDRAGEIWPGSMVLTTVGRNPQHMLVRTVRGLVHAHNRIGGGPTTKVREERWTDRWASRVFGIYEYRGVA